MTRTWIAFTRVLGVHVVATGGSPGALDGASKCKSLPRGQKEGLQAVAHTHDLVCGAIIRRRPHEIRRGKAPQPRVELGQDLVRDAPSWYNNL